MEPPIEWNTIYDESAEADARGQLTSKVQLEQDNYMIRVRMKNNDGTSPSSWNYDLVGRKYCRNRVYFLTAVFRYMKMISEAAQAIRATKGMDWLKT